MKKDRSYFRTLDWEGLKRWVKYGTDADVNWQELAIVLVERGGEEITKEKEKEEGYHHWG
jgi:hypothetical protein